MFMIVLRIVVGSGTGFLSRVVWDFLIRKYELGSILGGLLAAALPVILLYVIAALVAIIVCYLLVLGAATESALAIFARFVSWFGGIIVRS
jgi:hypothetical protein